ncbi:MAG: sigma-54-dependent Fis family transcriptional regulator [Deltaproteobacteria bacterium]|nr:sigma-54-dependent Fis family transcriptional regulator [Deltaproteobacteria bacterium]
MARILVVDDERRMADIVQLVLERDGHTVRTASRGADALVLLDDAPADVLLTDLKMPGMSGLELLEQARADHPALPVVLMTAYATVQNAIDALRLGAFDYIRKPFDNADLVAVVRRAVETGRLRREVAVLKAELVQEQGESSVIAASPGMQAVLDVVRRVARSRSTVLITGESGTGKEVVARALHASSDRVGAPFVAVNAKALADGVLESELFGHEKGAFTGANRARAGLFERADGGTLFLDEIGEIGADFQSKLLRVLQEREVQRVGGEKTRSVDVRLVAATNKDLEAEVQAGRFREDLYFRLAVIPVHIPPLRERREDIAPLARHFLVRQSSEQRRSLTGFSPEVEAWMASHAWPGNVRELENAVERGAVLCRGDVIELEDLLLPARNRRPAAGSIGTLQEALHEATKGAVSAALAAAGGVKTDAAETLGVDRTTLYRLLKRHDIE